MGIGLCPLRLPFLDMQLRAVRDRGVASIAGALLVAEAMFLVADSPLTVKKSVSGGSLAAC